MATVTGLVEAEARSPELHSGQDGRGLSTRPIFCFPGGATAGLAAEQLGLELVFHYGMPA